MSIAGTDEIGLSPAQARFARLHGAGNRINRAIHPRDVFLYREEPWATYRWLVDDTGQTIESKTFRRSPCESPEAGQSSCRASVASR